EAEERALEASLSADAAPHEHPEAYVKPGGVPQSMNPDISVILDAALSSFNTRDPEQLGEHDPAYPGFTFQQLELHLSSNVDPFFRFDANIVYGGHGVEIEEAYATTLALPGSLQVRAGQFLSRFGRANTMHPHQWHFTDQPLVLGKFYGGDGNRGIGTEVSWLSPLPWYAEWVASAHHVEADCCGRSFASPDDHVFVSLASPLYTAALKQFFPLSEDVSLLWGISGQTAPHAAGRTEIYGSDLYMRYRPVISDVRRSLSLQAEGMMRRRTAGGQRLVDYGGYAELLWGVDANWETGARAELVTGIGGDPLDPQWTGPRTRYAGQVTYYPTHFSRLRMQGIWGRAPWRDAPVYGALVSFEVVVGAHGAHTY
ncbi:MAG TPA: zinc-regulated TonB-dependent outer membrane receptor, partial [Myxococcota bacterium]|nr:zinc-regulated TonB-dependent outer membrane receptor [Myxococcota bacterium]